jgi:hypothetical protein
MSSIGYGVHPAQMEFTVPVRILHVSSVNILVPLKNMSLVIGHVALRYVYCVNSPSKLKPSKGFPMVDREQFILEEIQESTSDPTCYFETSLTI